MSPNISTSMPYMSEILELARILRKDGDQVLNGTSKFSLSTKLLYNLNNAFTLIIDESKDLESSFQVCNNSEIDLFRDLKFLHDFVQKTIWLKIVHTNSDSRILIDITKFRHLRYLELQKVGIDLVRGIQAIRGQLETISCTGSSGVGTIGRLLAACGGDDGIGFVWASLKRLALTYNGLGRLDKSLELAPWLQTLDLSHNFISIATELDCLPSLKYVNLGYNKLESVPIFNKSTYRSLQVLVLKNNYIENINGLQGLDYLVELDLSFNCIFDHSFLWPIEVMTTLLWLNLTGNPIAYHPRHRTLTTKYLHSSLAENKFLLDHAPLSKSEKNIVAENRLFTIRSLPLSSKDNLNSFIDSANSEIKAGQSINSFENDIMTLQQSEVINSFDSSYLKMRKKANVKEVSIVDDIERHDAEEVINITKLTNSYVKTSLDHLETKKKILELREKFGGEIWLSSHGGSFVQDIMGMEPTSSSNIASKITPDILSTNQSNLLSKSLNANNEKGLEKIETTTETTDNNKDIIKQIEILQDEDNFSLTNENTIDIEKNSDLNNFYDSSEERGEIFTVKKIRNSECEKMEDIFLIITSQDVKERDSMTGNVKYRWPMDAIISCVIGRGELSTIDFIFDTTRRDRQYRTYYTTSADDATKVVKIVNDLMKTRPLILRVFKCMKCSTHFSLDCDSLLRVTNMAMANSKQPICPSCKSTLVIQTDELYMTDDDDDDDDKNDDNANKIEEKISTMEKNHLTKNQEETVGLRHSASQSSIGTATSLDDSRESTPSTGTVMKKCESDIEILSNPSQSSIEVLDDGSKCSSTSNRKRSSEERRIAIAPTLLTIPDTIPVMTGLTESSSSGSLTDSICTAYENEKIENSAILLKSRENVIAESGQTQSAESIKNPTYSPVVNLTSMLGGLLQSMKIGTTREIPRKLEDEPDLLCTDMQYSYTDFKSVDHRIKLHLILNVFELENERLILLLRSDILMQNQASTFPACLVLSTSKIYVLRITGAEGEDPQRWLQKEISWTINRLRTFAPLPFKQGIVVELEAPNKFSEECINSGFLCILQDFQRTSNFLFYLNDIRLPRNCEVYSCTPEQYTRSIHKLMMWSEHHEDDDDAVRIFALFSSATLQLEMYPVMLQIGGLLVTTSSLILIDKIHWLLPQSIEAPSKRTEQAISNLIEVILDGFSLALNFFDEIAGVEDFWTLTFVSMDAVNAVINAIQPPWEELFSVPLQIKNKMSI